MKNTLKAYAFVSLLFCAIASIGASNDRLGLLRIEEVAPKYMRTMFPDLSGRQIFTYDTANRFWRVVVETQDPSVIPIDTNFFVNSTPCRKDTSFPDGACAPSTPRTGKMVFDGMFGFARGGDYVFKGSSTVAAERNESFKKLLNEHPEWDELRRFEELTKAGAKFTTANRKELLRSETMKRLGRMLGPYHISSCDFLWFYSQNSPNEAKVPAVLWDVKFVAPKRFHQNYEAAIEPFTGEVTVLNVKLHKVHIRRRNGKIESYSVE